jgi:predicted TIM-barrel fold metal-dependent hydrolase
MRIGCSNFPKVRSKIGRTSQKELLGEHPKQAELPLVLHVQVGEDGRDVVVLVAAVERTAEGVGVRVQRLALVPRDNLPEIVGDVRLLKIRSGASC